MCLFAFLAMFPTIFTCQSSIFRTSVICVTMFRSAWNFNDVVCISLWCIKWVFIVLSVVLLSMLLLKILLHVTQHVTQHFVMLSVWNIAPRFVSVCICWMINLLIVLCYIQFFQIFWYLKRYMLLMLSISGNSCLTFIVCVSTLDSYMSGLYSSMFWNNVF